ncbi:hypothetical protein GCK72_020595 [Caenorhabditis remanei]|uniref:Uncharacterized protein n=1 Tax=Caenorhabditis remanei TaxID=31234 RepID=A0A6A5GFN6_CAERE|nr:hypothetical protein GCK72_020595 [Caenorhabditis remanei]KAF1754037.1 hypothetical protein GCK72_020595 [Caenorhabditis remanei]
MGSSELILQETSDLKSSPTSEHSPGSPINNLDNVDVLTAPIAPPNPDAVKGKSTEINIDEFYPPTQKFLVFRHTSCRYYWIEIGLSCFERRTCCNCKTHNIPALKTFPDFSEARSFLHYLIQTDFLQKMQSIQYRYVYDQLERKKQIEFQQKIPFYTSIQDANYDVWPGRDGTFYKEWLFWSQNLPIPEVMGFNSYLNMMKGMVMEENPENWFFWYNINT